VTRTALAAAPAQAGRTPPGPACRSVGKPHGRRDCPRRGRIRSPGPLFGSGSEAAEPRPSSHPASRQHRRTSGHQDHPKSELARAHSVGASRPRQATPPRRPCLCVGSGLRRRHPWRLSARRGPLTDVSRAEIPFLSGEPALRQRPPSLSYPRLREHLVKVPISGPDGPGWGRIRRPLIAGETKILVPDCTFGDVVAPRRHEREADWDRDVSCGGLGGRVARTAAATCRPGRR
jgi:hypothetical protein